VAADFIVADPDVVLCEGQGPCVDLEIGDLFEVNTDALNVRETAGLDGDIVDVATFGAQVSASSAARRSWTISHG
jgi:hypothetical protein